jgi:hypothetical protein
MIPFISHSILTSHIYWILAIDDQDVASLGSMALELGYSTFRCDRFSQWTCGVWITLHFFLGIV